MLEGSTGPRCSQAASLHGLESSEHSVEPWSVDPYLVCLVGLVGLVVVLSPWTGSCLSGTFLGQDGSSALLENDVVKSGPGTWSKLRLSVSCVD